MSASILQLKVQQIADVCLFELTGAQGQTWTATVAIAPQLTRYYEDWQRAYLNFYQALHQPVSPAIAPSEPGAALRGRSLGGGSAAATVNRHQRLVEAEARLLDTFHHWLRSAELYPLRAAIAQVQAAQPHQPTDLFLTCTPLDLARLPWETWEITAEFGARSPLRLARTPANMRAPQPQARPRQRPRLLAILGDDTHLDIEGDRQAVQSLQRLADIQILRWQPGQTATAIKQQVCTAIADPQGWDLLFFAGHSDETANTGGCIGIAPQISLSIRELTPHLQQALTRGVQFALFNSCQGLNLATTLVEMGFSQVLVMREAIHNEVAQVFLNTFMAHLAAQATVQDALLAACAELRQQHNVAYPSAAWVPSLFRHPYTPPYALPAPSWRKTLQRWQPRPLELAAIAVLAIASWQIPVQAWLLNQRLYTQAVYRHLTQQVPTAPPELLLVQIDNESLVQDGIANPRPMDRDYLARLVQQSADLDMAVVGVDFLLDRPQGDADTRLAATLERVATTQDTWTILGASQDDTGVWLPTAAQADTTGWAWFGDIRVWGQGRYLSLISDRQAPLPFSHLIALAHQESESTPAPSTPWIETLRSQSRTTQINAVQTDLTAQALPTPLTAIAYRLNQLWLHPISDFSLPPQQVYARIPAWQFLRLDAATFRDRYPQRTVIIMSGGYDALGSVGAGIDLFPLPAATRYWRQQQQPPDPRWHLPGGELHAYTAHQLLHHRLLIPIPDLWMIGVAAIIGKTLTLVWIYPHTPRRRSLVWLIAGCGLYGGVSWQVYVSAGLLLPWLFPVLTIAAYYGIAQLPPWRPHHAAP